MTHHRPLEAADIPQLPRHRGWLRIRIGVNSGEAGVRELGGHGYVEYAVVGNTVNTGARLEGEAPVGGVLIGAETYCRPPEAPMWTPCPDFTSRANRTPVDAYIPHGWPR